MLGPTIIQIIGMIIFILTTIFVVKNFFIKFTQSQEPYKNSLLLLFSIFLLIGSLIFASLGIDLKNIIIRIAQESEMLTPTSIEKLKFLKRRYEIEIIALGTLISIIGLSLSILYINIKKEIHGMLTNPNGRWDWGKLK